MCCEIVNLHETGLLKNREATKRGCNSSEGDKLAAAGEANHGYIPGYDSLRGVLKSDP